MPYTPPVIINEPHSPEMTKYLRMPVDDDEEFEIRESIVRRQQSRFLSRAVGIGVVLAVTASLIGGIIFYAEHHKHHHGGNHSPTMSPSVDPLSVCFVDVSCPALNSKQPNYDAITGFTNKTGWYDGLGTEKCCNICSPNQLSTSITRENTVGRRHFASSNYLFNLSSFDYIIFDQMWLPQLCTALAEGHDPTLSHTSHSRCDPAVYQFPDDFTSLSIHGVWPSNFNGNFLSCCTSSLEEEHLSPVDPVLMSKWDIYNTLQSEWFDPTALNFAHVPLLDADLFSPSLRHHALSIAARTPSTNVSCGTCILPNHEFQKHGTCFGSGADASYVYFSTGLNVSKVLAPISSQINALAGQMTTTADLQALYPTAINVLCDPQSSYQGTQVFFEIRTCWNLTSIAVDNAVPYALGNKNLHWALIDCPAASQGQFSSPCIPGDNIYMSLLGNV